MQFLLNYLRNSLKKCKCLGGGSYAAYIKWVLSCDFQVTFLNGNIDAKWRKCNFSLTLFKENCLLLQLPINFSHTIDARIEKHACVIPLSIVIMATHLKFFSNFPF